ncbi:small multi-drug export protein [Patescibacteria group bacterium]|nr:small multi-drug export protein [Patescibacteria group bacterium]MBU1673940.1 small multi-drug export protein [Patescibacteria group bacterium]MBU1963934.1 small multi-drug export protein [Patescibacteria group bacterium]
MDEILVNFVSGIPAWLGTAIIAMIPVGELRAAIPIGISVFGLDWKTVFVAAVIGNMIPVFFILYLMDPVYKLLKKIKIFDRFFNWLFERTRKRFYDKHKSWGDFALIFFVAIPLPMTGAYTGALAAWLFGIKYRNALPLIFLGVIIAGIIVTLFTMGAVSIF